MRNLVAEQEGFVSSGSSYFSSLLWTFTNFIRRHRGLYHFVSNLRLVKRNGIKEAVRKAGGGKHKQPSALEAHLFLTRQERSNQENMVFTKKLKISILTPLYNTPEQSLREMADSVLAQTYGNWELCLADGSDQDHERIRKICESYAQKDKRIKYRKLDKDLGVSGNSNKAIEMSSGDYLGLLDQEDVLHPSALYEVMKVICGEDADFIYSDDAGFAVNHGVTLKHHKPDYAIDTLCSHNYISHFTVFDRKLTKKAGAFRSEFDGSQDYDLIFRYTDIASKICHIPKLLYFARNHENTPNENPAGKNVIREYLKEHGIPARVEDKNGLPGFYRVIYDLTEKPLVSLIIPNKNNTSLLRNCISSILEKTSYKNYEIIVVENNSTEKATFAYYEELKEFTNIRVIHWEGKGFNYSEICNFGAGYAKGQQLVFLNNDVFLITPDWIEEMLMYSQRGDVGGVGIKLYFLNGSIQHAGVVLGVGEIASHIYYGAPRGAAGYMGKLQIAQDMSAVTAACMMVRKSVFDEVGQFSPEFYYSFNDVDLCIRIRKAGYLIVWTPYAEAYHLESKSRGYNTTQAKRCILTQETALFKARWQTELAAGDPFYNCNFSLDRTDYSLK